MMASEDSASALGSISDAVLSNSSSSHDSVMSPPSSSVLSNRSSSHNSVMSHHSSSVLSNRSSSHGSMMSPPSSSVLSNRSFSHGSMMSPPSSSVLSNRSFSHGSMMSPPSSSVLSNNSSSHDSVMSTHSSSVLEVSTCTPATSSQTVSPLDNDSHSDGAECKPQTVIPDTELAQKSDTRGNIDAVLTDNEESDNRLRRRSYLRKSSNDFMRYVSIFENHIQQSQNTNPKIFIKLTRPKSTSEENILDGDNHSQSAVKWSPTSGSEGKHPADTYTPETIRKRGGYLQRVREFFRPRSSSLNGLNNEVPSPNKDIKTRKSNLKKAKSQSNILPLDITIDIVGTLAKDQRQQRNKYLSEALGSHRDTELTVPSDPAKDSREYDSSNTDTETTRPKVHTLERSYSLIRRESQENGASHVNFTRKTSFRIRRAHLSLLHHFTTVLPDDETDGCHVIKEATNIEPLRNGGAIVTDLLSSNIVLFDNQGCPKITFAVEPGCEPWATCMTPDGGLAVTLKRQGCVSLWSTSGEPIAEFGHNILSGPAGIQCDQHGRLVVADEQLNSVCVFNIQGELLTELRVPDASKNSHVRAPRRKRNSKQSNQKTVPSFHHPRYVCITSSGNYIIADSANHCIKIFDLDMNFKSKFGGYGKADGHFRFPYGIASDNTSYLYVADHFNNRVSLFSPEGQFIEHVLTDQDGIVRPKSVAVRFPFLYVTHGYIRSNKISAFRLRKDY